jgi:guanine deaminase
MDEQDKKFLEETIRIAVGNVESGRGGPFAALVVKNGEVIAGGTNQVTTANDPTAHAEVVAIRNACERLGYFQLEGCTVYSSCEPCPMCLGAIYWARPARLVFAATRSDAAAAGFDDEFIYSELAKPSAGRRIPTEHLVLPEGIQPFAAWKNLGDKTDY